MPGLLFLLLTFSELLHGGLGFHGLFGIFDLRCRGGLLPAARSEKTATMTSTKINAITRRTMICVLRPLSEPPKLKVTTSNPPIRFFKRARAVNGSVFFNFYSTNGLPSMPKRIP